MQTIKIYYNLVYVYNNIMNIIFFKKEGGSNMAIAGC